jgi:hypothetical protein
MVAVIVGAIVTSAGWPEIEQIVPRTACWAALIAALLNLVTEIFGADLAGKPDPHAQMYEPELPARMVASRAFSYFGWLAALLVMVALVGFVPAIGLFVALYMGVGFREPWPKALLFAAAMTIFCWALFDRGLAVPWPQAVLGDVFPSWRDATGLM